MKRGEWIFGSRKAQISVEYVLVVGFALLMIIPVVVVFFKQTNELGDSLSISQAEKIVKRIAETAEVVYYQGEPSQNTLTMYFPERINAIYIGENEISFEMLTTAGTNDVFAVSSVNITGFLEPGSGIKKVRIKAYGNYVNITEVR
jgi:uncharacterized protein (UPF0333 family)